MGKNLRWLFVTLIVLCVALLSFSTTFAATSSSSLVWTDPTAAATKPGTTFTSAILDTWQLPGTVETGSGMYLPKRLNGDSQFGGKGININDLASGNTVTLCFSFPNYNNSWSGKIYAWDGSEWASRTTSITSSAGSSAACTYRAGNGTYSLIIGYYGTPDYPTPTASRAWNDPVATANYVNASFNQSPIDVVQLPGTFISSNGLYFPSGFAVGEAQFGGKGIQISGVPAGKKVQICFSFPVYDYGWTGNIYQWNGTKWSIQPTTSVVSSNSEHHYCTKNGQNGTYSLIIAYHS